MQEKHVVKAILAFLHTFGSEMMAFKVHGSQYQKAGVPDVLCCFRGYYIGFEVKTDTGRTSEVQDIVIDEINQAGGLAVVVRSVDDVREVMAKMGNMPNQNLIRRLEWREE